MKTAQDLIHSEVQQQLSDRRWQTRRGLAARHRPISLLRRNGVLHAPALAKVQRTGQSLFDLACLMFGEIAASSFVKVGVTANRLLNSLSRITPFDLPAPTAAPSLQVHVVPHPDHTALLAIPAQQLGHRLPEHSFIMTLSRTLPCINTCSCQPMAPNFRLR